MVKDVVKSKCRMIDMWSCFQAVDTLKILSAGREGCTKSREEIHQQPHVVRFKKGDDNYVVRQSRGCYDTPSSAVVVL